MHDRFQLHLVTDRKQARGDPAGAAAAAVRGGVDWVQVREKSGTARGLYETALDLAPRSRTAGARLSVNDRVDVALATGADGVHLAGKSLPPEVARGLVGAVVLGVSVHSLEEAREAVAAGADYVTFGHVYPTSSKPGSPPRGVVELAEIVESVEVPVLAVGGIEASSVREVLKTGASGVAVISAVLAARSPEREAQRLRRALDDSRHRPRHPFPEPTTRGAR
ncbi:MAG: thiamine phosphate synthase [Rubrobacter sp.]|nr:thiamine phosphate synthase [Rubrobacter sp.]